MPRLSKYKQVFRLGAAIACLAYIVIFLFRNREDIELVFNLRPLIIFALFALSVFGHILQAYRFKIVFEKCSSLNLPFFPWFRIFTLGRFLNTVFPQAGNIYRSVRLKQDYSVSYTSYISSFASFSWMDTCLNFTFALAIVLATNADLRIGNFRVWQILAVLIVLAAAAPVLADFVFRSTKFRNRTLSWVHSKLSEVLATSLRSIGDGVYILKIILTGAAVFAYAVVAFYLCFLSLNVRINLPTLALFYVILKLNNYIIVTPGNLGVLELAYGLLSEQMGFGMAQGVLASVIMRIVGTVVVFGFGSIFGGIKLLGQRKYYEADKEKS